MPGPGHQADPRRTEQRVSEELDYVSRPTRSATFAAAYADDPDIYVPGVVAQSGNVLVTEWMDGTPLSKIITDGEQEDRDRAGILCRSIPVLRSGPLWAPARRPTSRQLPPSRTETAGGPWRLGVLDFGAVDRLPGGLPATSARRCA